MVMISGKLNIRTGNGADLTAENASVLLFLNELFDAHTSAQLGVQQQQAGTSAYSQTMFHIILAVSRL